MSKKLFFGYTLIELIVVIAIIMLLTSGGIVYFNDFNSKQKIESARGEIIANLQMARNYALTKQLPAGENDPSKLQFVSFSMSDGLLSVVMNETGPVYFTRQLTADDVKVDISSGDIKFASFDGKLLVKDDADNYVPMYKNDLVTITISTPSLTGNDRSIEIKSSGLINEK